MSRGGMKIFESLDILEKFANPVLTIGNYDGLHLGHQRIIEKVKDRAASISGTSILMTFEPHPLRVLKPEKCIGLITPIYFKRRLIEESGIDVLIIVPFTEEFRLITPEVFVEDILIKRLGMKSLIVGYDFRFGKDGKGDVDMLKYFSGLYGFYFEVVDAITIDGKKVGSNRIRRMIQEGEMERVKKFLGRPHMIEGKVIKGHERGKDIGFPTINIETDFELIPKNGVYVTEVEIDGKLFPSVTNMGYNPTFNDRDLSIETYILNFSENLYGREITLCFHKRIRDEMKFNSVDELKQRIGMDVEVARAFFNSGRKL